VIDRAVIVVLGGAAGALLGAALGLEYFEAGLVGAVLGGGIAMFVTAFLVSRL
jgi:hypothetical protein